MEILFVYAAYITVFVRCYQSTFYCGDSYGRTAEPDVYKRQGQRGVIHCYSYSPEMAQEYVKLGYHIGLGGVVTFKNAKKAKETARQIPLERILLETDSPYMSPTPFLSLIHI